MSVLRLFTFDATGTFSQISGQARAGWRLGAAPSGASPRRRPASRQPGPASGRTADPTRPGLTAGGAVLCDAQRAPDLAAIDLVCRRDLPSVGRCARGCQAAGARLALRHNRRPWSGGGDRQRWTPSDCKSGCGRPARRCVGAPAYSAPAGRGSETLLRRF